jgi:hypothetical protein
MLHLRPSDYRVMPWKDGGGSTTEIAIEPPGASLADPFAWRVSMARVEASGPFSRFPGYQRALVLLEGAGLILDFEGKARQRLKRPGQTVAFSGDDAVSATLIQGPCLDFGIISDPRRVAASLQMLTLGPDATSFTLAPVTLFFAPLGLVHVDPLGVQLGPMESLRFEGTSADPQGLDSGRRLGLRAAASETPLLAVQLWPL